MRTMGTVRLRDPMSSPSPNSDGAPRRQLSWLDSTSIIVGIIIGAGIYQTAPDIAGSIRSVWGLLALWLVGGVFSLVTELGSGTLKDALPSPWARVHPLLVHLLEVDPALGSGAVGTVDVIAKEAEVAPIGIAHQEMPQIVEIGRDRMRPPRAHPLAFVEARDGGEVEPVAHRRALEHDLHAGVERLGVKDVIEPPPPAHQRRDMVRLRGPVDVGPEGLLPADRVAREQKEAPERRDLVEITLDLDPIGAADLLGHVRPIAVARALDAADLVEERRQHARIGVAHRAEGEGAPGLDRGADDGLARLEHPFVDALGRVMDVAVVKAAMIAEEHDLPDGRARGLGHHPIGHALALGHPDAREIRHA